MFKIKSSISGSLIVPKIESAAAVYEFKNAITYTLTNRNKKNKADK